MLPPIVPRFCDRDPAGFARGRAQQRKLRRERPVTQHIRVGRERADRHAVRTGNNPAQLGNIPQAEIPGRRQLPGLEQRPSGRCRPQTRRHAPGSRPSSVRTSSRSRGRVQLVAWKMAAHQRLPALPSRPTRRSACSRCSGRGCRRGRSGSSSRLGSGCVSSSETAASTMPGVQMPHCAPPHDRNASWTACSCVAVGDPLDRDDLARRRRAPAGTRQLFTSCAVEQHRAGAALALAAAFLGAGQAQLLAQHVEQPRHRVRLDGHAAAVHAAA